MWALASTALAQQGDSVGVILSGGSGGGCQNLTGFNPPALPQPVSPGKIPCQENLNTVSTIQDLDFDEQYYPDGQFLGQRDINSFSDELGAQFIQKTVDSKVVYGLGYEHYSEYALDGVNRSRWYTVNIPEYLESAVNGNPDFRFARAMSYVVDGRAIALEIENDRHYLTVNTGESKKFELFPTDPDDQTALQNPFENPFAIEWVSPGAQTPHDETIGAIKFESDFDSALGRWRYFIEVVGNQMPQAGRYAVYFIVRRTRPVVVQYVSQTQGLLTWYENQRLTATLTVAYGLDQCQLGSALTAPSLMPLVDAYRVGMKEVKRSLKIATRILGSGNSKVSLLRRRVRDSGRFITEVLELETVTQSSDLALMNPLSAERLLAGVKDAGNRLLGIRQVPVSQKVGLLRLQRKLRNLGSNELASRPEGRKMVSKTLRAQVRLLRELNRGLSSSVDLTVSQLSVTQLEQATCAALFP